MCVFQLTDNQGACMIPMKRVRWSDNGTLDQETGDPSRPARQALLPAAPGASKQERQHKPARVSWTPFGRTKPIGGGPALAPRCSYLAPDGAKQTQFQADRSRLDAQQLVLKEQVTGICGSVWHCGKTKPIWPRHDRSSAQPARQDYRQNKANLGAVARFSGRICRADASGRPGWEVIDCVGDR